MSLELFVRGIYTHTAVARHPGFSWAFCMYMYLSFSLRHTQLDNVNAWQMHRILYTISVWQPLHWGAPL